MKRVELGIFIHPYSAPEIQKRAHLIKERHPDSFLTQELKDLQGNLGSILIAGGDGSVRRVIQSLYDGEDLKPIGLLGGGTNNVLYKNLVRAGIVLSVEDFLDSRPKKEEHLFLPGLFDDNHVFTITVGAGHFEKMVGLSHEKLRAYTPGALRRRISPLISLLPAMIRHNPNLLPLDLISTSPNFGSASLFPKQELHSSLLTHAWIEEKGLRGFTRLLLTLFYWQTGKEPPQSLLQTEQASSFEVLNPDSILWVDGDTLLKRASGNILVSRASRAVAITAIV